MAQSRHGNKHKKRANKYKNELLAEKKRKKDEYVRAYMEKVKEMQAAQEESMKRQENGQFIDNSDIVVDIDMTDELGLGELNDINVDQDLEVMADELGTPDTAKIEDAVIIEDEPSCPTEPEA